MIRSYDTATGGEYVRVSFDEPFYERKDIHYDSI